jgi:hypothetical protein
VAVIALMTSTFGCSPSGDGHDKADGTPTPRTSATSSPPEGEPESSASPVPASAQFCKQEQPRAWKQEVRTGAIAVPADHGLILEESDGKESGYFAQDVRDGRTELIWKRDGGTPMTLAKLPDPANNQFWNVRFDGRWVVFGINYDLKDSNNWKIFAWDSRGTRSPWLIADNQKRPAPYLYLRLHRGKAAWVQGERSRSGRLDGPKEIHLYDLTRGKDSVVHSGHVAPAFFAGDLLVWPEAFKPDEPTRLQAVSIISGRPAKLPPPIAGLRDLPSTASDGTTWAWASPDHRSLYAWRADWESAITVGQAREGDFYDAVAVVGNLVTWTGTEATWAADLRSHSFTRLTPQYGSAQGSHGRILVGYQKKLTKAGTPDQTSYMVQADRLPPLPTCEAWKPLAPPSPSPGTPAAESDST